MTKTTLLLAAATLLCVASPALAGNDTTNVQVGDRLNIQNVVNFSDLTVDGKVNVVGQSVGNSINLTSPITYTGVNADTAFASGQSLIGGTVETTVTLDSISTTMAADLSAVSAGNTASFISENGKLVEKFANGSQTSWQENTVIGTGVLTPAAEAVAVAYKEPMAFQNATKAVVGSTLNVTDFSADAFKASSTAVVNSVTFGAKSNTSAVAFQVADSAFARADLFATDLTSGRADLSAQGVLNNASWQTISGAADGINLQSAVSGRVNVNMTLHGADIAGRLNATSVAVGNIANISNVAKLGN